MNQSRGQRRGRRGRAQNSRPSAALQRYKAEMHGHENKLQMVDPTAVNLRPFNTIRLRFTYDTDQVGVSFGITVKEVVKNLLDQLGLTTQASTLVVFKLQRMDVFATAASGDTLRPSVSCDYSSIVPQLSDPTTPTSVPIYYPILKKLADTGSVSTPARVSYTWPLAMRDTPLTANADFTLAEIGSNVKDTEVFTIIQWSTVDVAAPLPDQA